MRLIRFFWSCAAPTRRPNWRHCCVNSGQRFTSGIRRPIFLIICALGALLAYLGVLEWIATLVSPVLTVFGLPGSVAPGVIFAIIRKDGLLVLNQGEGALLATLSTGQIVVLVYLASTLTACLVTLWTIGRELGVRHALTLAGRQAATALLSTLLLALIAI